MFEREYREMSFVPRWPIIRRIKEQSVAEHSYYVTLYVSQIADMINWKGDRASLLVEALRHDLDEVFMSDIPGPAKRATQDPKKAHSFICKEIIRRFPIVARCYTDDEQIEFKLIIKVADLLDEVFYLATEHQLGNRTVGRVTEHSMERLRTAWHALCDKLNTTSEIRMKGYDFLMMQFDSHFKGESKIVTG